MVKGRAVKVGEGEGGEGEGGEGSMGREVKEVEDI